MVSRRRRIRRLRTCFIKAGSRRYFYNNQWRVIEEWDTTGTTDREYVYNPADRWNLIRRKYTDSSPLDTTHYVLRDFLDPVAIINTSGVVQERYGYEAFGVVRYMTGAFGNLTSSAFDWNWLFHGEFLDVNTGLYNYGYRYYHPQLGRWPSRDPIGEKGGINLYGMVGNDAVGRWDYLGLEITKPPGDFLKEGECKTVTLGEYWELMSKWAKAEGNAPMDKKEKLRHGYGCIGLCRASQGGDERVRPESFPGTKCWAGDKGREEAEKAAKKCPDGKTGLVFSRQGVWVDPNNPPEDGSEVKPDVIKDKVITDDKGNQSTRFNYVTKIGDYYIDMSQESWQYPNLPFQIVEGIDLNKGKVTICKGKPRKHNYSAEIWCVSCCAKGDKQGYEDGYGK
ncbi:RHS repeat-associated core domain-containing protein [Akkermansiaceae bacterium]|nr:RHS repeat-associated core domain-containing protein [Akkermansiaceae bacterium]